MNNFTYYNPTKLIFGKGQLDALPVEVAKYGKKVLLVYGGGSIKRNGIYDNVINKLQEINADVYELAGVEPNPRISTVRKGVKICKDMEIEFVLAVGGGSTIDCTKAIAVGAKTDVDMWDIVTKKEQAIEALPFGTVLTIAATGSEMNAGSVITNWELNEKHGWGTPFTFPKFSILDPTHTFSLPREQTVYGIVDMMSHVLEHYFHHTANTPIQDRFCEAILRTVMETAPKLLQDLENYAYRETVMLSGTLALNGMLNMGYQGDWATHNLEHAVSAVHDIPHGGGLAILFPHWMMHVLDENVARFKQLAVRVFDVNTSGKSDRQAAVEGIEKLREFWSSIGAPAHLAEYAIDQSSIEVMADKTVIARPEYGKFARLTREDSVAIFKAAL
ncbi:iron-containing alcohol dehydrogenase [Virgibacillus dakarensis]|uniref:NADH-dependent alcohol dehydrogenase n=1 Tax=Lentibacillus populi TaxID=1827502 RepID=A0A9W5TX92_9BACI|nr:MULTISPECIES: iron-containing alcohol dehydrogenase [Bacillaceae]MTW86741.1 iron-containing alcohol dehydrogenase [Virgibacillus dakarensis]GGB38028.1 NADH-dependent alcohol dehydrogenase [Lentibacillus populi]